MDEVTQQNAALVEEATAAESLEDEARSLAKAVAMFTLDQRAEAPKSPVAKRQVAIQSRSPARSPKPSAFSAPKSKSALRAVPAQSDENWEEF
jgi:methyl-accepting chemotaxis protein